MTSPTSSIQVSEQRLRERLAQVNLNDPTGEMVMVKRSEVAALLAMRSKDHSIAVDGRAKLADWLNAFKADPFSTGESKVDRLIEAITAIGSQSIEGEKAGG